MTPAGAQSPHPSPGFLPFLRPSEMADRVRSLDWGLTALGPIERWPQSLRHAVGVCLNSRFPMFVWWGEDRINIYNDAYIGMLGRKHPGALGRPAREGWSEIWEVVGPQAEAVIDRGEATWNERVHLTVDRHGFTEDAWFTWSYSPIPDDAGGIGGLFCLITEDTREVLAERQRDRSDQGWRAAEARALAVLEKISDGYFTLDREWRYTYLNPRAAEVMGGRAGDALGRRIWDVFPSLAGSDFERLYRRVAEERAAGLVTGIYPPHDRWYEVQAYPSEEGLSVFFRDITERKTAEADLERLVATHAEQSRRFEQMLSSIKDFAYTFDLEGRFTFANKPLLDLLGRRPEEIVGMDFFDLGYPDHLASRHRDEIQRVIRTRRTLADESVFTSPAGVTASYQYIFSPVIGADGRVEAVAGSTRDITERKRLEAERERSVQALQWQRANLERMFEHAPAIICVLRGPEHIYEMTNRQHCEHIGHDDIIGKSVREVLPEVEAQGFIDYLDRVYQTGLPFVGKELPVRFDRDGTTEERFANFVYQAMHGPDGEISGIFVHGVDVTDLVRTREAARESEARYRTLFESIDQGFCIAQMLFDDDGRPKDFRIIEANPSFSRLTGLDGATDKTVLESVPDLERWWVETYGRVARTGETTRFENYAAPMGKWFEVYAFRFGDPAHQQVAIFFSDITQRKAAAEALRESEDRFRNLADHSPVMMWVTDTENRCTYINRAWSHFTGQSPGEGEGFGWLDAVHPDDVPLARDRFIEASSRRLDCQLKFRLRRRDGVYRWAIDIGAPRFGEDGTWLGYVGSVTDVSDLEDARRVLEEHNTLLEQTVRERTAELEASHRKLRLSERMAALGTLSAGLGHDMGNLLLPVRIRLDSLAGADLPQELRDDVEGIRTSAEYLRRLSSGLRMLSLDPERAARGDSTELLAWWEEAGPVLRNVLPRGVELLSRLPDSPCRAAISRPAITQAVFNLVQNAGDAMRSRGRGVVTVWAECSEAEMLVGVTDDGPAMAPDVQARCMEPFFTTKTREISTGMGLALVYGLVTEVGGTVEIDSQPGEGTTFTLRLPASHADRPAPADGSGRTAGVDIREPRLRAMASAELRSRGYTVRAGSNASPVSLRVVDEVGKADALGGDGPVVVLGAGPTDDPETIVTGEKPSPRSIRDAIRRAASLNGSGEGASS